MLSKYGLSCVVTDSRLDEASVSIVENARCKSVGSLALPQGSVRSNDEADTAMTAHEATKKSGNVHELAGTLTAVILVVSTPCTMRQGLSLMRAWCIHTTWHAAASRRKALCSLDSPLLRAMVEEMSREAMEISTPG